MCGICGEIRFDGRSPSLDGVGRMAARLESRGPDGHGAWQQGGVALAQRRLKIIDLSEAAAQPMVDPHLGLALVYNGAIYNYPELRAELEKKGYRFFSTGDTEVILKAFHAWGDRCVERFNGMFAFAIAERETGRVTLARDRLGIKPLYYAETPGAFRFASSLPALVAGGGVDTAIDPAALHQYMTFHAVVPAPRTILQGVRKVHPATTVTIEPDGTRRERTYWEVDYGAGDGDGDLERWKGEVLDVLRRAVRRRLVADVPVGVLLSGGLDSSLVVGLLAEQGQDLDTFSIGFESVGDEEGDEFRYSDVVVERFGTRHHKIRVDAGRALPALHDCVAAMSEPMVSHDAIGFYLLSEEVAKHVKVVQSGQGADEIFAGYHWYPPMLDADPAGAVDAYARVFCDRDHDEFLRAVHPRFRGEDASRAYIGEHFRRPGADRPVDKALRIDSTVMLVDDPVKRVDNMTMAHGLEARVPFLDHEVVELAARVPAELKVKDGGKHLLKEAARGVIPHETIDRPKGYFPVPALKYLRGAYLDFVRGIFDEPAARERELFDRDYLDGLFADPENQITPLRGSKLWQVALLEFWFQRQGI